MLVEAIAGQNYGGRNHGQALTPEQRWERGTSAVIDAMLSYFGLKYVLGRVRGRAAPGRTPPAQTER
jgi:hypothetical protein